MAKRTDDWSWDQKFEVVRNMLLNDMSQRQAADKHDIPISTINYWLKRFKAQGEKLPVKVSVPDAEQERDLSALSDALDEIEELKRRLEFSESSHRETMSLLEEERERIARLNERLTAAQADREALVNLLVKLGGHLS